MPRKGEAINLTPKLKHRLYAGLDGGAGTNLPRNHKFIRISRTILIDKNGFVPWNLIELKSAEMLFRLGSIRPSFRLAIDNITNR